MKAAYFSIDTPTFNNDVEERKFYELVNKYTLEFTQITIKNGRSLYLGVIKKDNFLFTQTMKDEEDNVVETIPSIFEAFVSLNPKVVGVTDQEGIPFGMDLTMTSPAEIDKEGIIIKEAVWELTGTPYFPFDIQELLSMIPPKIKNTYDKDGNVISSTEVAYTEPYLPVVPGGWKKPNWELIQRWMIQNG